MKLWVKIDTVAFEMLNAKNFNSNNVDALIAKKKKEKRKKKKKRGFFSNSKRQKHQLNRN